MSVSVLRVLPEAEAELEASAQWYESKRPGLGAEFVATVDEAFEEILEAPMAAPSWRDDLPWRRRVVRRFPYVIFFVVHPDAIEIVAVAHGHRKPGYWTARAGKR